MKKFIYLFIPFLLISCATPQQAVQDDSKRLTIGKVQQTLKKGMKQDEIVASLGSPNLVTRDSAGLETWIYDKLRTEVSSESSSADGGLIGGILGGPLSGSSNTASKIRSQKTLTVILKFKDQALTDFSYNSTSF